MNNIILKHSRQANKVLKQILSDHINRPIILFFSGGVDCLWIYAILKDLGHKQLKLVHFYPQEIDPSKIRDYQNVLKFINLTRVNVEMISYSLFDKNIHKQNISQNNRHYFRTFEQFILNNNLFNEKGTLIVRGEDRRIHTPFIRYSDYLAYRRKFGLPYWKNSNRFRGEHLISSIWNRFFGCNKKTLKSKFGNALSCKDMTYHQIHIAMCKDQENNQSLEDERIGGLYGKREVLFPFGNENFIKFSTTISKDICQFLKNFSFNEFYNQKVLIHTSLEHLNISPDIINSKSTLENNHPEFDEFLQSEGFNSGSLNFRWDQYINLLEKNIN
jgi:hypothetical protein